MLGGDHVRAYPAWIEDGQVLVDITEPSPDEARRECETSHATFEERCRLLL